VTDRWRVGANLATLGNALLGVGAIAYTLAGNKLWAMLLIAMAIGLDGLDGILSRRSPKPAGPFGRIADSVADAVTFGVAPAVLIAVHTGDVGLWAPYRDATFAAAVVYLACAAARLTYFTARAHALDHFRGVPTPEASLAVIVALLFHDTPAFSSVAPVGVLVGAAVISAMMLVPVPYPKIRRGAPLRIPMALTASLAALALVPLQFRPPVGSELYLLAEGASWGMLVGVAVYYLAGPFTVPRARKGASDATG
jgi:phosphatidylserine synthase